jgi:opacity protein-like surface antigen
VPATEWQGFYFGANIGAAWGDLNNDRTLQFFFPGTSPFFGTGGNNGGSGLFGGFHLGYNWQPGGCCFVFGFEADFGGMDVGLNRKAFAVAGGDATFAAFSTNGSGGWYGDITGRLGYSWGKALLYAKGGMAWFNPDLSANETLVVGGITAFANNSGSGTLTGWTAGAGLEYQVTPRWSWKIEYMHYDFSINDNNCCFDGVRRFGLFNNDLTADTVKIGFNYIIHPTLY